MAEISLSLNNIQNVKTVNLEGLGIIKVRKLGSGEELDLSTKMRRTNKILDELSALDFSSFDTSKAEDLKEIQKLTKKAERLSDELDEIKRFEFETYKRLITDEKNGKVVDVIMNTLTDQERGELFSIIFGQVKEVSVPEEPVKEADNA